MKKFGARAQHAPDISLLRLRFAGLSHVLELHDSELLCESLACVMPDWQVASEPSDTDPVTSIRREVDGTYSFQSYWSDRPLSGLGIAGATCGAVADIIQAYLDERPGLLGLHCGAVSIDGHLVAFAGTYRAGKTTLVTRLGAEDGCTLICDDILPIGSDGTAMALGIQPRLRLPLPTDVSPAFRQHVGKSLTVHDDRYGFVSSPRQAGFGHHQPLTALIILYRQDGARARFHELPQSEAAAAIIRQNIADPGSPDTHYDFIERLVTRLTCLTLVYSDLEDAVDLIRVTFGGRSVPRLREPLGPALTMADPDETAEPADLMKEYSRTNDVVTRQIGSDIFLWHVSTRNFFALNPVGRAVWTLMETPQSGKRIAATLHEVFPNTPSQQIEQDVAKLLGQMQSRALIEHR